MKLGHHAVIFLATGGYVGKIPIVPGTFGSLPGLLLCWGLASLPFWAAVACLALFILAAIPIAHQGERLMGRKDPGSIVIDEIAGMGVTLLGFPFTPVTAVAGFLVFRFFDILKPYPIRRLEQKIPGGAGIVADDILAGIYANLLLRGGWLLAGSHLIS